VEQIATDRVVVRLVPAKGFRSDTAERIRRQISERMGPSVVVSTEIHASLPRGPGGKLRAVISRGRAESAAATKRGADRE